MLAVYIRPSAQTAAATEQVYLTVSQLQTKHPQALVLVFGDFNHASLCATLPNSTQYINYHTRHNKTLLFVCKHQGCIQLCHFNRKFIHLLPQYTPLDRNCSHRGNW